MTAITETELKRLEDLINQRFDALEKGQQALQVEVTEIRTKLNTLEPSIQKVPDLAEKVGELKNWKQIGLVFVTAVISSLLSGMMGGVIGWLVRGGKI